MIAPPGGTRVWLAAGITDMRRGMDGLAALVQSALGRAPFSGHIFLFRGRRGDLIKILWWSGDGMSLYAKRLERGRFVWPQADSGTSTYLPSNCRCCSRGLIGGIPSGRGSRRTRRTGGSEGPQTRGLHLHWHACQLAICPMTSPHSSESLLRATRPSHSCWPRSCDSSLGSMAGHRSA